MAEKITCNILLYSWMKDETQFYLWFNLQPLKNEASLGVTQKE